MRLRRSLTRRHALQLVVAPPLLARLLKAPPADKLAVTHTTLIDGTGPVRKNTTIVVERAQIQMVEDAPVASLRPGTRVIDGRQLFVIPGLWDMHAHLSYTKASALAVLLANGVTGIRDMGGILSELDTWRTEVETAARPGPHIVRAGPIINGKQFNEFQIAVADAAEAHGAVRALHHTGVDFIKVHATISRDAYFGVHDECARLSLPYAGHMPRAITPEEASDAGQISLEHVGAFADRFESQGTPPEQLAAALKSFRKDKAAALFGRFAKNRTWFTPTLITSKAGMHIADHKPDPRDRYISSSCKKITGELLKRPAYQEMARPSFIARANREFEELVPLVWLMHRSGVRLLAGTDFAASILYPGFHLHDELALLVQAGLSPMEALQTATCNPARMLRRSDIGTIAPGKIADFVLLDANPLADIRNTTRIRAVVSRGRFFDRKALDSLLAQAEAEARTE